MPDPVSSLLVGPPAVNLARTAPLVPRPVLDLGQHEIALVNTGTTPVTLSSVECDPLRDNEIGAVTNARLVATAPTRVDQAIAPDSAVVVRLVGQVPARAGVYSSTLRVRLESGGTTAIPVTVTVAASPLRGIACTLLGLVLAGLINTLQVESDLYAKRTNLI